jgi:hypothetical protein
VDLLVADPLRARSIVWQEHTGQWTRTVVCKATYTLAVDCCALAPEPEDVVESDNHWDDDPHRSVYAPSDMAAYKLKPEVLLVGSAFARRGQLTRVLHVRLVCAGIDKSIDVHGPRTVGGDGAMVEGPPWSQMPLRYERASGGADTWNPVGVDAEAKDAYGRRALPNLHAPVAAGAATGAPVGFGPISPTWRVRRDKLGQRAATWSDRTWTETPLGAGFDWTFFQAAPLDQQVAELRPDQAIVLENMNPDHPRLVTSLPGVRPRVLVELPGEASWELPMMADTLWIDTGRALCTVTWRGRIPLDRRDRPGRVRVGVEESGKPVRWPENRGHALTPSRDAEDLEEVSALMHTSAGELGPEGLAAEKVLPFAMENPATEDNPVAHRALPFQSAPASGPPSPSAESRREGAAVVSTTRASEGDAPRPASNTWSPEHTGTMSALHGRSARPMPFQHGSSVDGQNVPKPVPEPFAPAAPISQAFAVGAPTASFASGEAASTPSQRTPLASPASPSSFAKPTFVSQAPVGQAAFVAPPPLVGRPEGAPAGYASVLEASNAAAKPEVLQTGRVEAAPPPLGAGRPLVEMIWFDPVRAPFLARQAPTWAELMSPPVDLSPDDPGFAEAWAKVDRSDVAAVLTRAVPVSDVQRAVDDAATEDGLLDTPVVMVAGDLQLSFDEVETLKLYVAAAGPMAGADKKLKEVLDLAVEVQKSPFGALPEVAAGWSARLREAWVKAPTRMLPADYLETNTRRLLLEQRSYQRRDLCNEIWVRGEISPTGVSTAVPVYLPDALARWLPLFARFPARIIAEAVPQQDQFETAPFALRAVAVARVISGPSRAR